MDEISVFLRIHCTLNVVKKVWFHAWLNFAKISLFGFYDGCICCISHSLCEICLTRRRNLALPEDHPKEEHTKTRRSLCVVLWKLQVGINLLNGLSRVVSGSSTGLWKNAG